MADKKDEEMKIVDGDSQALVDGQEPEEEK
jgi:hypothetical protein